MKYLGLVCSDNNDLEKKCSVEVIQFPEVFELPGFACRNGAASFFCQSS